MNKMCGKVTCAGNIISHVDLLLSTAIILKHMSCDEYILCLFKKKTIEHNFPDPA